MNGKVADEGSSIRERCRALEGPGLRTFVSASPLVLERAVGSWATDADGRRYLDLSGFHGVANIGHAHPAVVEAIRKQAGELIHCPTSYPSRVRAEFYEALASILPPELNAILPALSGAMANEIALLIAKKRKPDGQVVAFSGGYHGRSEGTVGIAGKTRYRQSLGLPPDAQFIPYPYPHRMGGDAVERVMQTLEAVTGSGGGVESVSAVVLEAVQGNGGVVIPPFEFLKKLRAFCDRAGALLIVDEVQAGCGRTGLPWAFQHGGIMPDIVTVGKAIGGGLPVAATVARREVIEWDADSVAGTFIANNLNLAAATAAIGVIRDERLAERSKSLGEKYLSIIRQRLNGAPHVAEIRGLGLWIAVELAGAAGKPASALAGAVSRQLQERGVLVGAGGYDGSVVKIAPALNIEEEDLAAGVEQMVTAIAGVH